MVQKVITAYLLLMPQLLSAQSQWGNLKPGPFRIGYKTIVATDYSRYYFEAGRPIQIYMWYPAEAGGDEMRYGDYFKDVGKDWGLTQDTASLETMIFSEFKSSTLNPSFPGELTDESLSNILKTKIPVSRDAQAAAGQFPLVLHLHAQGVLTQSVMLEYLASHGYVVMSVSMYGASPAYYGRGEGSANELLNASQDLAFLIAEATKLTQADPGKVAVIGMLAQVGLGLQMMRGDLDAIACLDCSWSGELLSEMPFYDLRRARMPVLELVNTEFARQEGGWLDSLQYAVRFRIRFNQFPHADFYPFPKVARPAEAGDHVNYELAATLTLHFLNAVLKNQPESKDYMEQLAAGTHGLDAIKKAERLEARPAMPTAQEFLQWLRYGEIERASDAWSQFGQALVAGDQLFTAVIFLARERKTQAFEAFEMYISAFPEAARNAFLYSHVGYAFLQIGQADRAEAVFAHWTRQYPGSPFGFKALGEAKLALGDKKEAMQNLEKAIDLISNSDLPQDQRDRLNAELTKKLSTLR